MHDVSWLDDYFAVYRDGEAGAHLSCHHPEALVLAGATSMPAGSVDRAAFERAHAARAAGAHDRWPYRGHRLTDWQEQGDEAIARVEVELEGTPALARIAFALVRHQGPWQVLGAAWDPAAELGFPLIRALAAAEFAYLPPDVARAATSLDLAYRRLYAPDRTPIHVLPEARFACHMTGKCCGKWGIGVGDAAQRAFTQVDWDRVVAIPVPTTYLQAPDDPEKPHRMQTEGDRCVFMVDQRCAIHAALGTPFNPTCITYPIGFVVTPDGAYATGSFNCPSARDNLGPLLSEREDDLRQRWWLWGKEALVIGPVVPLRRGTGEVAYAAYHAIEERWLALLGDESLPVPEALGRGVAGLRALSADPAGWTPEAIAAAFDAPTLPTPPLPAIGVDLLGAMSFGFLSQFASEALMQDQLVPFEHLLCLHAYVARQPLPYDPPADMLRRFLRQVLFRKRLLGEVGVVEHLHFVVLCAAFLRTWCGYMALRGAEPHEAFLGGLEALEVGTHHSPAFTRLLASDASIRASLGADEHLDGWLGLVLKA